MYICNSRARWDIFDGSTIVELIFFHNFGEIHIYQTLSKKSNCVQKCDLGEYGRHKSGKKVTILINYLKAEISSCSKPYSKLRVGIIQTTIGYNLIL